MQWREYSAGGLNSLEQILLFNSVILQETLDKHALILNPGELLVATGGDS